MSATDTITVGPQGFPLAHRLVRTFAAVVILQLVGLFFAVVLARMLSNKESYPWTVTLATDFAVILFGALLAEVATPSLKTQTSFDELISWRLTSLAVALTTLAPVAAYAAEIISRDPEHFKNQTNVLILLLRSGKEWSPDNLFIYRLIVLSVAAIDLFVATFAANRLSQLSIEANRTASPEEFTLLRRGSYVVLFVSIYLFCIYALLMHEWSNPDDVNPADFSNFKPLLIWSGVIIAALSIIAIAIVGCVKRFWRLVESSLEGETQPTKVSLIGDLPFLIIAAAGYFLWKLANDNALANEALGRVRSFLLRTGVPQELGNKIAALLRQFVDALAGVDLTHFLYIVGATSAFFVALAVLIPAIVTVRALWEGIVAFLQSALRVLFPRKKRREFPGFPPGAPEELPRDNLGWGRFFSRLGLRAAVLLVAALIVVENSSPISEEIGKLRQLATDLYTFIVLELGGPGQKTSEQYPPRPVPPPEQPRLQNPSDQASGSTSSEQPPARPQSREASGPTLTQQPPDQSPPGGSVPPEPPAPPRQADIVLSLAPLKCGDESELFWRFGDVENMKSESNSELLLVTSCRISQTSCQSSTVVGIGVASSKGNNDGEEARGLQRAVNLASVLKDDFKRECKKEVAAYVLNLGRYNDKEEEDDRNQREVIALLGTGSSDEKAVSAAVEIYVKTAPWSGHYTVCKLYKLENDGRRTPISIPNESCGDQSGSVASKQ